MPSQEESEAGPDRQEDGARWVSYWPVRCKMDPGRGFLRAFSGEAGTGSPQENASNLGSLIAQPCEAFLAAQHRQNVENAGRGGAPGQRRAQRLRHRAELEVILFGEIPHGG